MTLIHEGSISIQHFIEVCASDQLSLDLIWESFVDVGQLPYMCRHVYASHVVKKMLEKTCLEKGRPIIEVITKNFPFYCRERYSCFVVRECYNLIQGTPLEMKLIQALRKDFYDLCCHPIANYFMQHLISQCPVDALPILYSGVQSRVAIMSLEKVASHTIDAFLSRTTEDKENESYRTVVENIVLELCKHHVVSGLLMNQYGKKVLIRAIQMPTLHSVKLCFIIKRLLSDGGSRRKKNGHELVKIIEETIGLTLNNH
jgi:hypothetical protein